MNTLYLCKVSAFQASGNQIDIQKKVAIEFFNMPEAYLEQQKNFKVNICHANNLQVFESIELQPATNIRWSTKLNSFLHKNNDDLEEGDIIVFEKLGRSFCVWCIHVDDDKYNPLNELFDEGEKHMLLSATLQAHTENSKATIVKPKEERTYLESQEYAYMAAIKTKPFLILGGFSGTGKSIQVKEFAFATCPCNGVLNTSESSPGNYLLVSVKPNWHDATDITGFRSSVNRNYYVTDFMRFLIKAKQYPEVPFWVCLDEMNLAYVEEYFADFLSVIESRKRKSDGKIVTDPLVPASVFTDDSYDAKFNIFMDLGLETVNKDLKADEYEALSPEDKAEAFVRQDIVDELKSDGLTIPQNVIIVGTVNMDDTTNSFSRKVIDRAMTFETVVGTFDDDYFDNDVSLNYVEKPLKGELFISDEVRASEMLNEGRYTLTDKEKSEMLDFMNGINDCLEGTPFKISYRILNEMILLYRSKKEIARMMEDDEDFENIEFSTELNDIFDDILMQKVLPRIEGDYEKCSSCLTKLSTKAADSDWKNSEDKIEFMLKRFGKDKSGFTSFWN